MATVGSPIIGLMFAVLQSLRLTQGLAWHNRSVQFDRSCPNLVPRPAVLQSLRLTQGTSWHEAEFDCVESIEDNILRSLAESAPRDAARWKCRPVSVASHGKVVGL
jgi:hypothetical protein